MNPVRDLALFIQPLLPASDGWQAASVLIAIILVGIGVLAVAGLGVWIAEKMGFIDNRVE